MLDPSCERSAALLESCLWIVREVLALHRSWFKPLAVALLASAMMVAVAPAPAHAANIHLGQKLRTIYSPDLAESQVWHVQFWQTTPVPNVCRIFGRSLMDTFRGQHGPIDYLDSVRLYDLTTGVQAVPGPAKSGYPPIAHQTNSTIQINEGVTHSFKVSARARVDWWGYPIGASGLHEYTRSIKCVNTTSSSGEKKAVIKVLP
jgi:hypothetical protein